MKSTIPGYMSLQEVNIAIGEWQLDDELAQSPRFCRRSAIQMMAVAQEADVTEPHVQLEFVVWPDPSPEETVHYALIAICLQRTLIFNPTPANGFPQYSGDLTSAPGRLCEMKVTPRVI